MENIPLHGGRIPEIDRSEKEKWPGITLGSRYQRYIRLCRVRVTLVRAREIRERLSFDERAALARVKKKGKKKPGIANNGRNERLGGTDRKEYPRGWASALPGSYRDTVVSYRRLCARRYIR